MTMLSAAEVTSVADEAFAAALTSAGFSMQKPRHWIRTTKSPIHELIQLYVGRIAYGVHWGVSAIFVPAFLENPSPTAQFKKKHTTKSSQIDFHLGPRLRNIEDHQSFEAGKVEINDPVHEVVLGVFERRIPLPNLPKYLADEAGIRAIVENGCRAALKSFEAIQHPRDVVDIALSSYEKTLAFPPKTMPSYWLTLGIYQIACGREDEAEVLFKRAFETFDIDLVDPILQESIAMARSHAREKAA